MDAEFERLMTFEQIRKGAEATYKANPLDADVSFSRFQIWRLFESFGLVFELNYQIFQLNPL